MRQSQPPAEVVIAPGSKKQSKHGSKSSKKASSAFVDKGMHGSPPPVSQSTASSPEPAVLNAPPEVEPKVLTEWEMICVGILKRLAKHEYVDMNRDKCICNFYVPVMMANPLLTDYAEVIKEPMDLTTLTNMVDSAGMVGHDGVVIKALKGPEEFYQKLVSVFSNTVEYNGKHMATSSYADLLVKKCKHLIRYCKWLCLEKLPLTSFNVRSGSSNSTTSGTKEDELEGYDPKTLRLTLEAQEIHREYRMNKFIKKYGPTVADPKYSLVDSRALLRDMEKTNTKAAMDKKIYSWLSVYVPICVLYLFSDMYSTVCVLWNDLC